MNSFFLAIETTTPAGSIALFDETRILYHDYALLSVTHSETLMSRIDNALKAVKADKRDLKAVCISNGPGSFTGVRIGLATAKGICTALHIPLIPFDTLQVLAANVYGTEKKILSILDARMNEAYVAVYDKDLNVLIERHCRRYEGILDGIDDEYIAVGDVHLLQTTNIIAPLKGGQGMAHRRPNTEHRRPTHALPHQNIPQASAMLSLIKKIEMGTSPLHSFQINLTFDVDMISNLEPYYVRSATSQVKII